MPKESVWILDDKYTGEGIQSKLKRIAEKLDDGVEMMLVTTLDDIAWMLNLRGNDIEFNPIFFSYVLLHKDSSGVVKLDLFIDNEKVS
jgi:Xaa-Pro aminopeptidase